MKIQAALFCLCAVLCPSPATPAPAAESIRFGRFGDVAIYRLSPHPAHVVLFVSGDVARELATLDALVAGIDIQHYLKEVADSQEKCSYAAADFEALSQFIQKKLGFPGYVPPVLVGYSSGATLVYALLVEAPHGTFQAGISMGFCPDLPLAKPLCRGDGLKWKPGPKGKGVSFLPASTLKTPWVAFQGLIDKVCDAGSVEKYVKQVGSAEIVLLPKVGHGFSVPRNWMPQFKAAFTRLVERKEAVLTPEAPEVKDLPLVEVPARAPAGGTMAVLLTGDGGWAGIDRDIAGALAARGVSVVGWNSLEYYWKRRTPDEAAKDLERVLQHYLTAWNKKEAILVGYSLGADVLPFMVNRLPAELLEQVRLTALLGLESTVDFEFHVTEWLESASRDTSLPVEPEIEKLKGMKILCFYGEEEKDSLCRKLPPSLAKPIPLPGGHHFGGDYASIVETILRENR
jgi:type IV secretory pathway VirJ component